MLRKGETASRSISRVAPARLRASQRECADQFATLIDGRRGSRLEGRRPRRSVSGGDPHRSPRPRSAAARSPRDQRCRPGSESGVSDPAAQPDSPPTATDLEHGRILRGRSSSGSDQFVAEKLAGARDDRIEHLLDVGAAGNRALQQGEPLEQGLALPKLADQAGCSAARGRGHGPSRGADPAPPCCEVPAPGPRDQKRALLADQRADPGADPEGPRAALESEVAGEPRPGRRPARSRREAD